MISSLFSSLPIWIIYIIIVLLIVFSVRSGIAYASWRRTHFLDENDSAINTLVGATLGLLAFILAFTFSMTTSRFDARKHFLLEEINSIETSWLRSGLVEEPYNEELQKILVEYVEIRIWLVDNPKKVKKVIEKSLELQTKIWALITELTKRDLGNDRINVLLIDAVNDMFDNQTRRISIAVNDRIPNLIWIALFTLIVIAMFEVGYLLGKTEKSNWVLVFALSMAFATVVVLIVDLDSSNGHITINNQSLYDMYDRIKIKQN
jgi:hypothetical protein